jgi:chorismate mutase/prephenate dehydratase
MFSLILPCAAITKGDMIDESEIRQIRAEIDAIDTNVHDQLVRRVELAIQMAAAKDKVAAGQPRMRPGREAAILRSLLARHAGPLEFPVVARIWRELINANLRVEGDFRVAFFADGREDVERAARSQFGDLTPCDPCDTAQEALTAAAQQADTLAVLPFGSGSDDWALLAEETNQTLGVIAALPFVMNEGEVASALCIGTMDREDTGQDTSLAIVEGASKTSEGTVLATTGNRQLRAIEGYVAADAPLWRQIREAEGASAVLPIGGYADPIILGDM